IETNQCAEKPPIGFDNAIVEQVAVLRQTFFQFIERVEEFRARSFVWSLSRGETGSVNTVIDVVVEKIAEFCMLGFDLFWEKIDIFIFRDSIECGVKHAADIVLAVVNNLFRFLVPKNRHRYTLVEIRIGCLVSFAEKMEAIYRIG